MDIKSLKIISNNLPSNPGVYQFFDSKNNIIYIKIIINRIFFSENIILNHMEIEKWDLKWGELNESNMKKKLE